jgi:hypothetical protein
MKKATQSDSNAIYDKNVTHSNPNKRVDPLIHTGLGFNLAQDMVRRQEEFWKY